MKNYYKMLGMHGCDASDDEILRAINVSGLPEDVRETMRSILLVPSRRRIYDRTWIVLANASQARANLGVKGTSLCGKVDVSEFQCKPAGGHYSLASIVGVSRRPSSQSRSPFRSGVSAIAVLLFVILLLAVFTDAFENNRPVSSGEQRARVSSSGSGASNRSAIESRPPNPAPRREAIEQRRQPPAVVDPDLVAIPLPDTGTLTASLAFRLRAAAPLRIKAPRGEDHYYIKVVDMERDRYTTYFLRSGEMLDAEVPFGSYEVRYATGRVWYGEEARFGPQTVYSKADEVFVFYQDGNQAAGYTIELIRQPGGNLNTKTIREQDF